MNEPLQLFFPELNSAQITRLRIMMHGEPSPGLTNEQNQHVTRLQSKFSNLLKAKYEAGAREHGGNLWDVDVLDLLYNLRDEVIDAFVYLQTAIDEFERPTPKPASGRGMDLGFPGDTK